MKVQTLMTRPPQTCPVRMTLAAASRRMRETGCGTLMAIDPHGRLAGILTDRDLALAVGNSEDAGALPVELVMTRRVRTCLADTELGSALEEMARHKVRRLAVMDRCDDVIGVISIDDIILWGLQDSGIAPADLIAALRSICAAERPVVETGP